MNFIEYPVTGANPAGVINWKRFRTSQQIQSRWSTIEKTIGVYDAGALADFDSMVTFQKQNGVHIQFSLYGTPPFYAQTYPNPLYADNITLGPWAQGEGELGLTGESSFPTDTVAMENFIVMIIHRYNLPGGAWYDIHGETLGKGINSWEPITEPIMTPGGVGNGNTTGTLGANNLFWWGKPEEAVDSTAIQYAIVKATDDSIIFYSPSCVIYKNFEKDLGEFLRITGPVTGKRGIEVCDEIAWHPYHHISPYMIFGEWSSSILTGQAGVFTLRNFLTRKGYPLKPLCVNEWGVDLGSSGTVIQWYLEPPSFRYTMMARFLMTCAALGITSVYPWKWEDVNPLQGSSGDWQNDSLGVVLAYNDFSIKCAGKTIIVYTCTPDGVVSLYFNDNTSWIV
jgi:hypothetical protein